MRLQAKDVDRSPGMLLVVSAASGTGKTSLIDHLLERDPAVTHHLSVTTRAPRGTEKDGVDYHFVSRDAFDRRVQRGEFLEWADVHGNRYGTSKDVLDDVAQPGRVAVVDVDVQGGKRIKEQVPEAVLAFVVPPSIGELERRLRARGTDTDEVIRRRMATAREQIEVGTSTYDYVFVNDSFGQACDDLTAIVRAERLRRGRSEHAERLASAVPAPASPGKLAA